MYERYKLCDHLKPSEVCLVVEQYTEGTFIRIFHQHVPKSRLSDDARRNLLRALVIRFSGIGAETVVHCYLNERGLVPAADNSLKMDVSYPEPGVLRLYCGANTKAWSDQVIAKWKFRQPDESANSSRPSPTA
jgi:hypothetical protein